MVRAKSIQAEPKRSQKGSSAKLQAASLKGAFRNGAVWEQDEVERLIAGIERDETTFELSKALGRSYYGTMGARAHVAFISRHFKIIPK